jgi:general secretion pathway protein D
MNALSRRFSPLLLALHLYPGLSLSLAAPAPMPLTVLGGFDSLLLLGNGRLSYTYDPATHTLFIPGAVLAPGTELPEGVLAEAGEDGLRIRFAEPYRVAVSPDERRLQAVRVASLTPPARPPAAQAGPDGPPQPQPDERLPQLYRLSYADPATVAAQLGQLYGSVRVVVDERQRALLVLVNPADRALIDQVVRMLDAPRPQVAFEAEVIEINRSLSQALGIDYDLSLFRFGVKETNIPNPTGGNPVRFGVFGRDVSLPIGFSATLNLLQSSGAGRVLAKPRVVTTDGVEARINATQNLAVIVTNNNVQAVQNLSTGITLRMLPKVAPDGSIEVQVSISVSAPTSQTQNSFSFSTRDATTTVRVGSGEAIVIGGLLENRRTESVEKVPGLGDIPVLGELFKTTSTTTAETDLVIVITPRLLTPLR